MSDGIAERIWRLVGSCVAIRTTSVTLMMLISDATVGRHCTGGLSLTLVICQNTRRLAKTKLMHVSVPLLGGVKSSA